jgi:hypothetical protein
LPRVGESDSQQRLPGQRAVEQIALERLEESGVVVEQRACVW